MIKLYFPNVENGSASVGYCSVAIVNHVAEVSEAEAIAIAHWMQVDQAEIAPPDDELLIGVEA